MATASDTATPEGAVDPAAPAVGGGGVVDLAVGRWSAGEEEPSKSDRYLARRLAAASADYKSVALTTFVLGAAVAGGVWLAVGILAEHWLVPGGLSPAIRWAWLGAAAVALAVAAARWLVPLVRYRVNLVYAARAIERENPELHNDLVNTVLVKARPESNPARVVRSLERRTAKRLADVPVEAVIDRTVPLRLACALAAIVGLAGLYEIAAPKSLLVSAARLLAPWVGWAAPSRVRIEAPRLAWRMPGEEGEVSDALDRRGLAVEAGTVTLVRGRQLVVAAEIRGLRRGERPEVFVAPLRADGGIDATVPAWKVELIRAQAATGSARTFVTALPDAARGLDQSVEITIAAGDARTAPVRVAVVDSPTLLVRELRYAYPAYTRRAPESVAWQGDIRAVEGTEVTIVAESNQPLEDAWIDFDGDGDRDLRFSKSATDLARVTKTFHLHLDADGRGPEHSSYRLLFQPRSAVTAGREQVLTDPLEHRIEVFADVAPEVTIEEPRESPLRVPPAAPVAVRVQAHDPDFALARVGIETRLQGAAPGSEIAILEKEHAGVFRGVAQLVPERLGAGPGAVLEYRAVAVDNRAKRPNVSHSPWQALRIDPSAPPRQPETPPPGRQQADGESASGNPDGQGQAGGQQGRAGEQGPAPRDRDSGAQDGERQDRQKQQAKDDASGGGQEQERKDRQQPQPATENQQGQQDGQAQGAQGGDGQPSTGDQKQSGNRQGEGQNQGQGAERGQGIGARGERQGGAEQQAGKQQDGRDQAEQQSGGREIGDGQTGADQSGNRQAANRRGDARGKAVAADGTNDGEAMERILDHRREQGDEPGQAAQQRDRGEQSDRGRQGDGVQPGDGRSGADASGGREGRDSGTASAEGGNEEGGKQATGQKRGVEEGAGKEGAGKEGAGKEGAGKEGAGKEGAGKEGAGSGSTAQGAGEQAKPGEEPASDGQTAGQGQDQREDVADQASGSKPGPGTGEGRSGSGAGDAGPTRAGEPGSGSGQTGNGGWAGGAAPRQPGDAGPPDGPPPSRETEWGDQDLAHARNAADLALEHLRKAVDSGDTDILDRLGWTRDEARAFLERWEKMRRFAESTDPGERVEFERTMRSLGLRSDGVRSSRDVPADRRGGQAEGRRSRPPADYQEQFKAYTQGTSGE